MSEPIAKSDVAVGIGNEQSAITKPPESGNIERILPKIGIAVRQDGKSGLSEGNLLAFDLVSNDMSINNTVVLLDVEENGDMLSVDISDMEILFDVSKARETMIGGRTHYVMSVWMATDNDDVSEIASTVSVAIEPSEHYEIAEPGEIEGFGPDISMVMLDDDIAADDNDADAPVVSLDDAEILLEPGKHERVTATVAGKGSMYVAFRITLKSGGRERTYRRTRKLNGGISTAVTGWRTSSADRSLKVEIVPAGDFEAFVGPAHFDRLTRRGAEFGIKVGGYEVGAIESTSMRLA